MSNWYVVPSDKDLMHYGILGMKWGVRRYQNKDGSLTAAGRKRYGDYFRFNGEEVNPNLQVAKNKKQLEKIVKEESYRITNERIAKSLEETNKKEKTRKEQQIKLNEKEMNDRGIKEIEKFNNFNMEVGTYKDSYNAIGATTEKNNKDDKYCLDVINKNKSNIVDAVSKVVLKDKDRYWVFDDPDTEWTDKYSLKPWDMSEKQKETYLKNILDNSNISFRFDTEKNNNNQRIANGEMWIDDYNYAKSITKKNEDVYCFTMNADHGLIVPITINCDNGDVSLGKPYW